VFGLVSYLVEQRRREFGIRVALGATPGDVWQTVIRQSLVPAVVGLTAGIGAAWALESVVRSSVFGWQSSGVAALAAVAVALLGVAVLAAAVPARRAMRIDPAVTLRAE
jgi:ABC-type antimicrobial peptide transport system permease subunit